MSLLYRTVIIIIFIVNIVDGLYNIIRLKYVYIYIYISHDDVIWCVRLVMN